MKNQNDTEEQPQRTFLFFLLIGICALFGWVTQTIRPLYNLSQNQSLSISINATKTADYSSDFFTPIGNVRLDLIFDVLRELNPDSDLEGRQATLIAALQTPVAHVTVPAGSAQPTVPATIPPAVTLVEPPTTAPPTEIPNTPVPPAPKPKKTNKKPPPPTPISANLAITKDDNVTTYSASGSLTYTVTVTNNSGETVIGAIIADTKPANILNWAWACTSQTGGASGCDPAASGTSDFSDTINLPVGGSIVYTVSADIIAGPAGDLANTATISVPSGYTDTNTGNNSATDTDTFDNLYINIIVPPTDGTNITNADETKFEAEAWDSVIGTSNGDGITSVTFDLKNSVGIVLHNFEDTTLPYCVFDGDPCDNAASTGFYPFTPGIYTIEATVLSTSAITKMVTRTFVIP